MKKNYLRVVCLILSLVIIASLFGCNTGGDKPEPSKGDEIVELTLWHIWAADSETAKKPLEDAIKQYEADNKNVKIKVQAYQNELYKTKIKTAMAGNKIPDIFFSWGAAWADSYIKAGKVLALNEYASDVESKWKPGTKDNFVHADGNLYAFPMTMWAGILFCNGKIFEENNVEPPKTYDELLKVVKVFKEKNIIPLTIGASEPWTKAMHQNVMSLRTAGLELTKKALNGEESFDKPEFVESAAKIKELLDAGAFGDPQRALSLSNDEAQQDFVSGKTAMRYMGSWEVGNIDAESSKIKDNVVCLNFPGIEGKGSPNTFQGGAQDTFMISKDTKNKEEAVKFLKYITEKMSEESYKAGYAMPAWNVKIDESIASKTVMDIDKLLSNAEGFCANWDTALTDKPKEDHLELVSKIFTGSITPEDFAKEMAATMEKNK